MNSPRTWGTANKREAMALVTEKLKVAEHTGTLPLSHLHIGDGEVGKKNNVCQIIYRMMR
jgi:hypothetical protein